MLRLVLLVFALFLFLTVLRGLRIFLTAFLRRPVQGEAARRGAPQEGEMVRDPICGTWVDRRLALSARRGGEIVPVCSEKCLKALEAR
jgi:YHS domain-containing protein